MLSMTDMRAIARYEDRYLDPDCDTSVYSEEKEEAEWDKADRRYAEKCLER